MARPHLSLPWHWLMLVVACGMLGLIASGCSQVPDLTDGPPLGNETQQRRSPGLAGQVGAASQLQQQLVPPAAVPVGLRPVKETALSNAAVARLLPDPAAARATLNQAGRLSGALVDYQPVGETTAPALLVSSSVAQYRTDADAARVLSDALLPAVLAQLGLQMTEISDPSVGEQSRAFRGSRASDPAELTTYAVLVRRARVLGHIVVVLPVGADDEGHLARSLAQQQASVLQSRAAPAAPGSPSETSVARGSRAASFACGQAAAPPAPCARQAPVAPADEAVALMDPRGPSSARPCPTAPSSLALTTGAAGAATAAQRGRA